MFEDGHTSGALSRRAFYEKQAALEAGFRDMERGLKALGAKIEDYRDQLGGPSEIANMAINASRLERKFLSLKKKLKAPTPEDLDAETKAAIKELSEQDQHRRYNTRALQRETRRNAKILNALADKLKAELDKRRAEELKAAREKAAKVRLAQNPNAQVGRIGLRAVPKKSADILPFPKKARG